jgi:hypothetical protein
LPKNEGRLDKSTAAKNITRFLDRWKSYLREASPESDYQYGAGGVVIPLSFWRHPRAHVSTGIVEYIQAKVERPARAKYSPAKECRSAGWSKVYLEAHLRTARWANADPSGSVRTPTPIKSDGLVYSPEFGKRIHKGLAKVLRAVDKEDAAYHLTDKEYVDLRDRMVAEYQTKLTVARISRNSGGLARLAADFRCPVNAVAQPQQAIDYDNPRLAPHVSVGSVEYIKANGDDLYPNAKRLFIDPNQQKRLDCLGLCVVEVMASVWEVRPNDVVLRAEIREPRPGDNSSRLDISAAIAGDLRAHCGFYSPHRLPLLTPVCQGAGERNCSVQYWSGVEWVSVIWFGIAPLDINGTVVSVHSGVNGAVRNFHVRTAPMSTPEPLKDPERIPDRRPLCRFGEISRLSAPRQQWTAISFVDY